MKKHVQLFFLLSYTLLLLPSAVAQKLEPIDVFDLEFVSDPQVSPDGSQIIYQRNFKDIMTDANRSNLWIVDFDGSDHQPLTTGKQNDRSPRWSPDGQQCAYISSKDGSSQVYL
ncbi:MAG: DPP IV N-terminal domain-containing protein, partial [Bacteroidota bacterium]